ncbi:MAG: hypothetical protein JSS02_18765 [Planctomycetes bacterium]|nr:hypothetical protein [Planctomycetota bacterium]
MKSTGMFLVSATSLLLGVFACISLSTPDQVVAQEKSKPAKKNAKAGKAKPAVNTKNLDVKADQLQSSFTRDAEELATQYADAGFPEKARAILESALAVNPQAASVQKKLEQIKENVMNANVIELDVNAAHGWDTFDVLVAENQPVRIRAEGSYKFDSGPNSLTAAGFVQKDPGQDMLPNFPCGALLGMVVIEPGKSGKPFLIGEHLDFVPKESGTLLLRVNAPPGNRNAGKLKVAISGHVQSH